MNHTLKTAIKSIILLVTAIALAISSIPSSSAQSYMIAPSVEIRSPISSYTKVYSNTTIEIEIVVANFKDAPEIQKIYYSLDGHTLTLANMTKEDKLVTFADNKTGYIYYGRAVLENLPEGNYTLIVHVMDANSKTIGSTVNFTIDLDYKPPTFLSPQNQTHYSSQVPLTFCVYEEIVYAYYSLNGGAPVYVTGNTTLTGLSDGPNQLNFLVKFQVTIYGFVSSFNFSKDQSNFLAQMLPTVLGIVFVLLIVTAIAIYKKGKVKKLAE